MKELWDPKESIKKNMSTMGIAFDANNAVTQSSTKAILIERAKRDPSKDLETSKSNDDKVPESKQSEVIRRLEAEAAEAEANQKRGVFPLLFGKNA